jgi:hypothetical protein
VGVRIAGFGAWRPAWLGAFSEIFRAQILGLPRHVGLSFYYASKLRWESGINDIATTGIMTPHVVGRVLRDFSRTNSGPASPHWTKLYCASKLRWESGINDIAATGTMATHLVGRVLRDFPRTNSEPASPRWTKLYCASKLRWESELRQQQPERDSATMTGNFRGVYRGPKQCRLVETTWRPLGLHRHITGKYRSST